MAEVNDNFSPLPIQAEKTLHCFHTFINPHQANGSEYKRGLATKCTPFNKNPIAGRLSN